MNGACEHNVIYTRMMDTPLGTVTVSAENGAVTGLWFVGQKYYPTKKDTWIHDPDYPVFKLLRTWLSDYFSGIKRSPDLRLEPQGTAFQKVVWKILLKIPIGQVTTYGEIARKIAAIRGLSAMSAQAVGGAVGHNPISILIPCHRVVGSNRSLTGYAGGLDKKEALLRLEHVNLEEVKPAHLA
jgi:methylated-DNA-[protein]-cysteine S-methyltransferase